MIHNLPTCRLLTVDVPDGAINIGFLTVHNMLEWKKKKSKIYWDCKLLPPGNWTLLGRFDEITENVWKGIIPKIPGREKLKPYRDYEFNLSTCWTATESARSLIEGNPVVLIEKK